MHAKSNIPPSILLPARLLTIKEMAPFLGKSDWYGIWAVLVNYGLIILALAFAAIWPHPLVIVISMVVLGNRQLGLGILMHDCVHSALFRQKRLNKFCGTWLFAAPILAQYDGYKRYHLNHHALAGTQDDPDYQNYCCYPVSKASVFRKCIRDICGITAFKTLYLSLLMHAGLMNYDMAYQPQQRKKKSVMNCFRALLKNLGSACCVHGIFILILVSLDALWLYGLWWLAFITFFALFSRIRNAAEHANVPDLLAPDPRLHARTVNAGWLAKMTVAPNHVNFHLEHHWHPGIPPINLKRFHRYLIAKGLLEQTQVAPDYWHVIRQLTVAKPTVT